MQACGVLTGWNVSTLEDTYVSVFSELSRSANIVMKGCENQFLEFSSRCPQRTHRCNFPVGSLPPTAADLMEIETQSYCGIYSVFLTNMYGPHSC